MGDERPGPNKSRPSGGLMGSAIALTAFSRGDRWAWWPLLVANTVALASAMAYDRLVNSIGPFDLSEYLGLALVCSALAATAPFHPKVGPVRVAEAGLRTDFDELRQR